MALTMWGQLIIQTTTPGEDPVQVGTIWIDTSTTPTIKICTAISPYTFTTIDTAGIENNAITDAKLRDSAAVSVIGRSANSSGDPADIVASANEQILGRTSNVVAFEAATGTGSPVRGTSPTLTTPTISGAISFPDNIRQTFNPGADAAGLNVGSHAGDPGTPSNGDLWYDSTANELTARVNGTSVVLGGAHRIPVVLAAGDSGGHAPAAATTYYFAALYGVDPGVSATNSGFLMPYAGTINRVIVRQVVVGTNGVNGENITYVLRNTTTATDSATIATLDTDDDVTINTSTTALGFSVAQNDELVVKFTTPAAWTTAPTAVFYSVSFILEVTP